MTFLESATAVIRWWASTLILGLALWPLAFHIAKKLPDRGWAFARMIGILVTGYFFWLGCWLRLWPNVPGAVWLCAAVLFAVGTILDRRLDGNPWLWLREHRKQALFTEGVFLVLFVGLSWIRAYDAGATHTERPMDLAFLNAIMRSDYFPPDDPWLSGYAISYYHFGYILTGMLAKMSGLAGSVAFSFGVTGSFAMAGLGAYGLLRNLLILKASGGEKSSLEPKEAESDAGWRKKSGFWTSNHLWLPLLATFMLVFMGNFEGSLEVLYAQHIGWEDGQGAFWKALDINGINVPPFGEKSLTPTRNGWWWWAASRVVHDQPLGDDSIGASIEIIDEFPAFSIIIGDMHPHVMALPFLLLAILVVLEILLRGGGTAPEPGIESGLLIAFSALAFGSLLFLNTWDILIFGMAFVAGWLGWRLSRKTITFGRLAGSEAFIARWAVTGISAIILFVPFLIGFSSQAGGILPNALFPTKGSHFFVMFGTLLIPVFAWLVMELWSGGWKPDWRNGWMLAGGGLVLLLVGSLVMAVIISLDMDVMDLANVVLSGYGRFEALSIVLTRRFTDPLATIAPIALIATALAVLLGFLREKSAVSVESPASEHPSIGLPPTDVFVLILMLWGALMVLFPEYFYLRDFFNNRMNTIFKFYFQGWTLLSLTAAYGACRLFQRVLGKSEPNTARRVYAAAVSIIVLATMLLGAVYFPMAVQTKTRLDEFPDEPTLDASSFVQWQHPDDAAAISWILENIPGDGPIVEGLGRDYDPYAGVVATVTGIPIVLGWQGHEDQWRGANPVHRPRIDDVEELYRTTDWDRALEILGKYGIRYVYFGPLERATYGERGLEKFFIHLNVIYLTDQAVIFERAVP
jgi:YYY domain-containing protein